MLSVVHQLDELRAVLAGWRGEGARIALVPTMGNLHAGHLRLVERAARLADRVCVSIFVNPLQFDCAEDLAAYPSTLNEDRELLAQGPAHMLYAPSVAQMYPLGEEGARVEVPGISGILEGASRPGHFSGVATVVGKFFNRVQPDLAVFGEKDFQQLLLIRRMVTELDFPVEIIGEPTVREADGLAMSSRNAYLSATQRQQAPRLYARLCQMAAALRAGRRDFTRLAAETAQALEADGFRPDYVTVRRVSDLLEPQSAADTCIILAAAWLGRARLIDNIPIEPGVLP